MHRAPRRPAAFAALALACVPFGCAGLATAPSADAPPAKVTATRVAAASSPTNLTADASPTSPAAPLPPLKLDVRARTLANGLKVLVHEDHSIPTASVYLVFKIGSRNERTNATGLSHFFEHMMFNGAKKYGHGEFDRMTDSVGGNNNAYTSRDVTVFHEQVPAGALETVFDLEADRMENLDLDPKVVETERGAVASERRTSLDANNQGVLDEVVWATAFIAHPYRWSVFGWMVDIQNWTTDELKQHYKAGYSPSNCVVVVAGDVSADAAFALAEKYLAPIPKREVPPKVRTTEPPQIGERRVVVRKASKLPYVQVVYHVCSGTSADYWPLQVMVTSLFTGESSRVYRQVVDKAELATSVGADLERTIDPTLLAIGIQPAAGVKPEAAEAAVYSELEKVQKAPLDARELQKCKNVLLADLYRSLQAQDSKADLLGTYEAINGDYHSLLDAPPAIDKVTAEDVRRVAKKYLVENNRTVGTLVPTGEAEGGEAGGPGTKPATRPAGE